MRNMRICASQASASCTRRTPARYGRVPDASNMAARYTARKPLPCSAVGRPNAAKAIADREHRIEPRRRAGARGAAALGRPSRAGHRRGCRRRTASRRTHAVSHPSCARPEHDLGGEDGQQHRHRIVQSRLDLEHRAGVLLQAHAAAAQHREHGRGIGRGHDAADQAGDRHRQPERDADARHDRRRQHHGHRGEQRRRQRDAAEDRQRRVEAAVEQNQDEGDRAEPKSEPVVVERNASRCLPSPPPCRGSGRRSAPVRRGVATAGWQRRR